MKLEFLTSENLYLRPYEPEDAKLIFGWFNDPETTYYMFTGQKPKTLQQIQALMQEDTQAEKNAIFIAIEKKSSQPIGLVGLYEIHQTAKKAEMRIIIGNSDFRGRGYGTEMTEMINFYGFDRLNLHRIYLGVTAENKGGVHVYEKAGYIQEGLLKDDVYRNSRYYDAVRMAILRDDYYKKWYAKHQKRFGLQKKK